MTDSTTRAQREVARRLRVDVHHDLVHRYVNRNQSLREISSAYGVSIPTISRWLQDVGVQRRPIGRPPATGRVRPTFAEAS